MPGYSEEKDDVLRRLRLIEGQMRGLQRMVEEDVYCIDVLTQIASVNGALQKVGLLLFQEHLRHCVAEAVKSSEIEGEQKISEVVAAVNRLLQC